MNITVSVCSFGFTLLFFVTLAFYFNIKTCLLQYYKTMETPNLIGTKLFFIYTNQVMDNIPNTHSIQETNKTVEHYSKA